MDSLRTTVSLVAVLALAGCAIVKQLIPGASEAEIERLEAANEYDALREHCKDNRPGACDAETRVAARLLRESPCEQLAGNSAKFYDNHRASRDSDAALATQFDQCGQLQLLFEVKQTLRWHTETLVALDNDGRDVFAAFTKFLVQSDTPFAGRGEARHAEKIVDWLAAAPTPQRCQEIDPHMDKLPDDVRRRFLWLYGKSECGAQALPHARRFLSARSGMARAQACNSHVRSLELLATTDAYKQDREVRLSSGSIAVEVAFPVRESCKAAAGKILLRAEQGRSSVGAQYGDSEK